MMTGLLDDVPAAPAQAGTPDAVAGLPMFAITSIVVVIRIIRPIRLRLRIVVIVIVTMGLGPPEEVAPSTSPSSGGDLLGMEEHNRPELAVSKLLWVQLQINTSQPDGARKRVGRFCSLVMLVEGTSNVVRSIFRAAGGSAHGCDGWSIICIGLP